jgi:hypothetical protein
MASVCIVSKLFTGPLCGIIHRVIQPELHLQLPPWLKKNFELLHVHSGSIRFYAIDENCACVCRRECIHLAIRAQQQHSSCLAQQYLPQHSSRAATLDLAGVSRLRNRV